MNNTASMNSTKSMEGSYPFTELVYGMPSVNMSYLYWNNFAPENIGKTAGQYSNYSTVY
jgi:hypothetical protein